MTYAVFKAGSSELLCMGTVEQCAESLGATVEQVQEWVDHPQSGYRYGFSIQAVENSNPMQCPCDTCAKAPPKPAGVVSASCGVPQCARYDAWSMRYWNRLRKRFYLGK